MNRRSFLSALTLSVTAIAADPERFLWTKTKSIFIPPAPKIAYNRFEIDGNLGVGDIVTFAGAYSRNPVTDELTHHLQRFLIIATTQSGCRLRPLPLF